MMRIRKFSSIVLFRLNKTYLKQLILCSSSSTLLWLCTCESRERKKTLPFFCENCWKILLCELIRKAINLDDEVCWCGKIYGLQPYRDEGVRALKPTAATTTAVFPSTSGSLLFHIKSDDFPPSSQLSSSVRTTIIIIIIDRLCERV
jgi:hypothetical protein